MRASRLVTLLGLLQARGRMSTRQLAAELEVCERTVLRDIEALGSAGIPVYPTRGRHGGFELLDGFTSDLPGLTRRHFGPALPGGRGSRPAAPRPRYRAHAEAVPPRPGPRYRAHAEAVPRRPHRLTRAASSAR